MSAAETRQMLNSETGQRPVAPVDICLVSAEDIGLVSTADICPVSTADICPVSTEDIWRLWGHLRTDENNFDPFFSPKMRKMKHDLGDLGEAGAPEMEPRAAARSLVPHAPGARIT